MHRYGLRRLVLTSAWGAGETAAEIPGWFRWFIQNSNIGPAYRDHERQEALPGEVGMKDGHGVGGETVQDEGPLDAGVGEDVGAGGQGGREGERGEDGEDGAHAAGTYDTGASFPAYPRRR